MSHTHGLKWTENRLWRLVEVLSCGFTTHESADILSAEWDIPVTTTMVHNVRTKHDLAAHIIEKDNDIEIHDKEIRLPDGPTVISSDEHSPYHNERWLNRMLMFSEKMGIKRHVAGGDLFDMSFAKWSKFKMMTAKGEGDSTLDAELDSTRPVLDALDYFDENYLILGNHENRVDRLTDGRIQARHIIDMMGMDKYKTKFTVSVYDKLFIGEDFMVVHPKSYSQISGSVAVRLAEKFHRHVLNAHGHFVAMRYDRSSSYVCCDIGGMFDVKKIDYICKKTTTHPTWNNGFAAVMDGGIELVHGGNLSFWGLK